MLNASSLEALHSFRVGGAQCKSRHKNLVGSHSFLKEASILFDENRGDLVFMGTHSIAKVHIPEKKNS